MVSLNAMLLRMGIVITLLATASAKTYKDHIANITVASATCYVFNHKLHANTNYEIRFSNVTLPLFGLQCSASDLLVSRDFLTKNMCQERNNATCVNQYEKSGAGCIEEYDRRNNGNRTSFVALEDDVVYDNTLWFSRRSCTNGDGFLYMRNQCRRDISLVVKVVQAETAASTGCREVFNLNKKKGISRTNLIIAIVVPLGVVVLVAIALLLFVFRHHFMGGSQQDTGSRPAAGGAPATPSILAASSVAPAAAPRGNTATLSAVPVNAKDAPFKAFPGSGGPVSHALPYGADTAKN